MTTEVAAMPRSWVERASDVLRRLPPRLVRGLIMADMALGLACPPWGYFFFSRWSGRLLGPREFAKLGMGAYRFVWAHITHNAEGTKTGAFYVDWTAPPVRRSLGRERADWANKGGCGTCMQCCSTTWRPEGQRVSCPFLGGKGCTIYGGLYWDYFNCGRYPAEPAGVAYYGCPRFEGIFEPRKVPEAASAEPRRLPVLAASAPAHPASVAAAPSSH